MYVKDYECSSGCHYSTGGMLGLTWHIHGIKENEVARSLQISTPPVRELMYLFIPAAKGTRTLGANFVVTGIGCEGAMKLDPFE